jgi:hypothetical protein
MGKQCFNRTINPFIHGDPVVSRDGTRRSGMISVRIYAEVCNQQLFQEISKLFQEKIHAIRPLVGTILSRMFNIR